MVMANGFNEMSQNEMMNVDGGGVVGAVILGGASVLVGGIVIACTPCKATGVKIIKTGLYGAAGLLVTEAIE